MQRLPPGFDLQGMVSISAPLRHHQRGCTRRCWSLRKPRARTSASRHQAAVIRSAGLVSRYDLPEACCSAWVRACGDTTITVTLMQHCRHTGILLPAWRSTRALSMRAGVTSTGVYRFLPSTGRLRSSGQSVSLLMLHHSKTPPRPRRRPPNSRFPGRGRHHPRPAVEGAPRVAQIEPKSSVTARSSAGDYGSSRHARVVGAARTDLAARIARLGGGRFPRPACVVLHSGHSVAVVSLTPRSDGLQGLTTAQTPP